MKEYIGMPLVVRSILAMFYSPRSRKMARWTLSFLRDFGEELACVTILSLCLLGLMMQG